tara:strand:+ start:861 stop:2297 length:1437 start_codon:yes stop_codon:yes gene_type:complete
MSYLFKNSDDKSGLVLTDSIEQTEQVDQEPGSNTEREAKIATWIDEWLSNIKGNSERKAALISHLDRRGSKARLAIRGSLQNRVRNFLSKKHRGEQLYDWFLGVVESNLAPYSSSSVVPGLESEHFNPYNLFSLEWTTEILHSKVNPGEHRGDDLGSCSSKIIMQIDVWNTMDEATKHKFIIHELGHWWDWLVGCLSHSEGSFLNEDEEGWAMHEDGEVRWTVKPSIYSTEQLRHSSALVGAIYSDVSLWNRISQGFGFKGAIERGLNNDDFVDGVTITDPAWLPEDWTKNYRMHANEQIAESYLSMNLASCKDFLPTSSSHARNPWEMYSFMSHEWLRGSSIEEEHFNMLKKAKDYLNQINWEEATCDQAREARETADKMTMLNGAPFRFTALLFLNTDDGWPRFNRWVNGLANIEEVQRTSDTESYDPTAGTATASAQRKSLVRLANMLDEMGLIVEADEVDSLIRLAHSVNHSGD